MMDALACARMRSQCGRMLTQQGGPGMAPPPLAGARPVRGVRAQCVCCGTLAVWRVRCERKRTHSAAKGADREVGLFLFGLAWCENLSMMEAQHQVADVGSKQEPEKRKVMRTPDGRELPAGRPKGTPNRVTRTIREAVEMAAKDCHPKGLAGWLVERAQGSLGDRQIFAAMVNKAMPLQVQANVDGGIRLELGWLAGRQIGTTAAQIPTQPAQVLDLQRENDGTYRIIDQSTVAEGVPATPPAAGADANSGPPGRSED